MKLIAASLLVVLLLSSIFAQAQKNQDPSIIQIKTVDGNELSGTITYEDSISIVVTTQHQGPISIQKSDIKYQGIKNGFNELKKNGISINLFGTSPFLGVTYERLLSKYISLEAGVGLVSIGAGIKIFPFKVKEGKIVFHTGLTIAHEYYSEYTIAYLPLGISLFPKNSILFGIDLGPAHFSDEFDNDISFLRKYKIWN